MSHTTPGNDFYRFLAASGISLISSLSRMTFHELSTYGFLHTISISNSRLVEKINRKCGDVCWSSGNESLAVSETVTSSHLEFKIWLELLAENLIAYCFSDCLDSTRHEFT